MKKAALVFGLLSAAAVCFAQSGEAVTLDTAISSACEYLKGQLETGTKIAVLNFSSSHEDLSVYIIDEVSANLVNKSALTVVERRSLALLREETDFQMSGEVSDATAQSIGQKLGAQTVVSGGMTRLGNLYRFRIQALSVRTAAIQGMQSILVRNDVVLAALTQGAKPPREKSAEERSVSRPGFLAGIKAGGALGIADERTDMPSLFTWSQWEANAGFAGEVYAAYMFIPYIGVEAGVGVMTNNGMKLKGNRGNDPAVEEFSYMSVEVPLGIRLRLPLDGSGRSALGLNGGAYLSIPVGAVDYSLKSESITRLDVEINGKTNYGFFGGASIDVRLGPGNLVLGARFFMDLTALSAIVDMDSGVINKYRDEYDLFTRKGVMIFAGYEYLF